MVKFVKLSIFGTVFEVPTRYMDLQPVGMGAFGLVWYVIWCPTISELLHHKRLKAELVLQLRQGPVFGDIGRSQKNHEALFEPGFEPEYI